MVTEVVAGVVVDKADGVETTWETTASVILGWIWLVAVGVGCVFADAFGNDTCVVVGLAVTEA